MDGKQHDVPCVFQIWIKKTEPRATVEAVFPKGFVYVKHYAQWDLAVRRVGVNAGRAVLPSNGGPSPQSHYFVSLDAPHKKSSDRVAGLLSKHQFPSNTVGPRSLSKPEVSEILNGFLAALR